VRSYAPLRHTARKDYLIPRSANRSEFRDRIALHFLLIPRFFSFLDEVSRIRAQSRGNWRTRKLTRLRRIAHEGCPGPAPPK